MDNLSLNTSTHNAPYIQNTGNSLQILAAVASTQLDELSHHRQSVQLHNLQPPSFFDQLKHHDTYGCPLNCYSTCYLPHTESKLVPVKPLSKNEQWDSTTEIPNSFCSAKPVALKLGRADISGLNNAKQTKQWVKPVASKSNRAINQAKYARSIKGQETIARYAATPEAKLLRAIKNTRGNVSRAARRNGYNPELAKQIVDLAIKIKKETWSSGIPFRFSLKNLMTILQAQQHENHVTHGRPLNHFSTSYLPRTQSNVTLEPGKAHISDLDNVSQTIIQAIYVRTVKGKMTMATKTSEAIRCARKNARRAAEKKGYSPELVKQIVDLAGKKKEETLLSGAPFRFPVTKLKEILQSQQKDQGYPKNNF